MVQINQIVDDLWNKLPWNQVPDTPRVVHVNRGHDYVNDRYCTNHISTTKYNVLTFIPKNLLEQFTRFANILFLLIACLQLFTGLSPTGRYGYAVSLTPMILVQMIKDAVEDIMRAWTDQKVNNQKASVFHRHQQPTKSSRRSRARSDSSGPSTVSHSTSMTSISASTSSTAIVSDLTTSKSTMVMLEAETAGFVDVSWKNIQVGDIVKVKGEELIPADMVILHSNYGDGEGKCYVETSQLDGETNLKQRNAMGLTQDLFTTEESLKQFAGTIECDQPNKNLYSFTGTLTMFDHVSGTPSQNAILYENIIMRGTKLKNTAYVYALVIYTGKHSKLLMNNTVTPHKRSKIEFMMNLLVVIVFTIQLALSLICAGISTLYNLRTVDNIWYMRGLFNESQIRLESFYQGIVVFFLLFNNFVPIGLLASLEFIKLGLSRFFIDKDEEMVDSDGVYAHANTSNMPEELGQIKMIFSDKTGTLTKNKMTFKKFYLPSGAMYGRSDAKATDKAGIIAFSDQRVDNLVWKREKNSTELFNMFHLLALCQTVLPEYKDEELVFQASSPDELTLVTFAQHMGFEFIARTETSLTLRYLNEETKEHHTVTYDLLNTLHFNSFRKRMSVIVRVKEQIYDPSFDTISQPEKNQLILLTKGADDIMIKLLVSDIDKKPIQDSLNVYATEGLRTLICARKVLSEEEYNTWNTEHYTPANLSLQDRQDKVDAAAAIIESGLDLVGVTAIDDELQDNVAHTIEQLRKAGIKVFMLTGDKQETAITIAHSCALLHNKMQVITLTDNGALDNVRDAFSRLHNNIEKELQAIKEAEENGTLHDVERAVVVNGQTLDVLFDGSIRNKSKVYSKFMKLCMYCKSIICARSSPSQKSKVVALAKKFVPNNRTLAIGDGANDIPMIQEAHVGVGISGKEGLQASRTADFAIGEFRFLERLLLIHGRNNYRRVAKFILHTTYKNIANQSIQFYFAFFSLFGGKSVHLNASLILFNLLFTLFPMVSHAFFDQEVSQKKNLAFPELYREGQRDYYLNLRLICTWILNAFYQAAVCFFIPYGIFVTSGAMDQDGYSLDFHHFSTVVSTSVLLVVTYKVIFETNTWHIMSFILIAMTMPLWFAFLSVYNAIPSVAKDFYFAFFMMARTGSFWLTVFLSSTIAVLWDFVWKVTVRTFPGSRRLYHFVQELPEHLDVETMRAMAAREFDLRNT